MRNLWDKLDSISDVTGQICLITLQVSLSIVVVAVAIWLVGKIHGT
jgi:hypothetical protein